MISSPAAAPALSPAPKPSFPFWPSFSREEIRAASRILTSGKINYWTGNECRQFELEYAAYLGLPHTIALCNGTLALELGLRALGIGPGDEVITSSYTFIASASCAVAVGAKPVCADIDPDSLTITAETIRPLITRRTRAIIPVHLGGWPCDMDPILRLARQHRLKVIEDCAQAHGATYKGRPVGSMGDAAAFSFCQDKIITTGGEGGLLALHDKKAWERAWAYKDHGKNYQACYQKKHSPGFRWLHESFGTNGRMTEIQAGVGRIQLRRLAESVRRRRANATFLQRQLSGISALRLVQPPAEIGHAYYRYYFFLRPERLRPDWNRDRIQQALTDRGIPCFVGSCPEIYREKAFAVLRPPRRLAVASRVGQTALALAVHPTLRKINLLHMIEAIHDVVGSASVSA